MFTPIFFDNEERLTTAYKGFAKEYKQFEQKDAQTLEQEVTELEDDAVNMCEELGKFSNDVRDSGDTNYTPTMVVQARRDKIINIDSVTYIHEHVEDDQKQVNCYEDSGHVITLRKEKDQLREDIDDFLQSLDW